MVSRHKPKVKKLKFELTRSGIGGIAVVVFCLFLWMFLVGVWAGQTLLAPSSLTMIDGIKQQQSSRVMPVIRADKKAVKKKRD
ncbi:MAG: hypothetical protein COA36_01170 [Desulfotalea sp.]|nr:MAG: hypothetical protein COA36_01170 [Desulfotalea sp.]